VNGGLARRAIVAADARGRDPLAARLRETRAGVLRPGNAG
jgi:hypothetical protein